MQQRRVLIVGATGLVGTAATEHFDELPDWEVVTLSRRRPLDWSARTSASTSPTTTGAPRRSATHRRSPTSCTPLSTTRTTSRPGGAAINSSRPTWRCSATSSTVWKSAARCSRVTILQGGKALRLPSRPGAGPGQGALAADAAPHLLLAAGGPAPGAGRRAEAGAVNILRPQLILGRATSSPMNIISAIGVYAAVQRELGQPLQFPGGGIYVTACTDSRLIARAVEFCATSGDRGTARRST